MKQGVFITFEGGEGSGKTTIINKLKTELTSLGYDIVQTREPGGSDISEQIRSIILNINNTQMGYRTEALLYAASRAEHLDKVVNPALNQGKVVLCDRYLDASLVYQGVARNLGIDEIYQMNLFATHNLLPQLTILINLDPVIGLNRIKSNNRDVDRLDLEKLSFHQKVHQGYLEVARKFPDRIKIVDGEQDIEKVYQDVLALVKEVLK